MAWGAGGADPVGLEERAGGWVEHLVGHLKSGLGLRVGTVWGHIPRVWGSPCPPAWGFGGGGGGECCPSI